MFMEKILAQHNVYTAISIYSPNGRGLGQFINYDYTHQYDKLFMLL
jgi:hypothetical protein